MIYKFLAIILVVFLFMSCRQSARVEDLEPIRIEKSELRNIIKILGEPFFDLSNTEYLLVDSIMNFTKKSIEIEGTTYLICNVDGLQHGVWTKEMFDSASIAPRAFIDSVTRRGLPLKIPNQYSFSLPYFSKDKNSFIIYYYHFCGSLCAEYSERLYKKINGKWTYVTTYAGVIS